MPGARRGLVAPQNTFLENIIRRSNGQRKYINNNIVIRIYRCSFFVCMCVWLFLCVYVYCMGVYFSGTCLCVCKCMLFCLCLCCVWECVFDSVCFASCYAFCSFILSSLSFLKCSYNLHFLSYILQHLNFEKKKSRDLDLDNPQS